MDIKQIEAKDTYSIRQQILRPTAQDQTPCQFSGDEDELTFHLGGYVDDKLVSVASFFFHTHNEFKNEYQFQLRGMATLPEYRGQGFSTSLLRTSFPLIKNKHVQKVWCNARTSAVSFYEKVGFEKVNTEFDIEGVGPHFLMHKDV